MLKSEISIKHRSDAEGQQEIIQPITDVIFYIPSRKFIFDLNKRDNITIFPIQELAYNEKDLLKAELTNQVVILEKVEYIKVLTDKFPVWVERAVLKYMADGCRFKVNKNKFEVFIYKNTNLVCRIKTLESKGTTLEV